MSLEDFDVTHPEFLGTLVNREGGIPTVSQIADCHVKALRV